MPHYYRHKENYILVNLQNSNYLYAFIGVRKGGGYEVDELPPAPPLTIQWCNDVV